MAGPRRTAGEDAPAIGIYVHVPYCTVRCSYCDFYLQPRRGRDPDPLVAALCAEIDAVAAPLRGRAADTIHFGGGTPSLLPPGLIGAVLEAVDRVFALLPGAEIALEANPEDLDGRRCGALAAIGVNRIAIGVQTLDDRLLRTLRRPHDAAGAVAAVRAARRSRIASVGADLMLALPGQTRDGARRDAAALADLGADHLSLYLLELHARTRLGREVALGRLLLPGEDEAAASYEETADLLETRGYEHYEISNFALAGRRSRHNQKYWTDADYIGFGPSAHSYVEGERWSNEADLDAYLAAGGAAVRRSADRQPRRRRGFEALFAGLRLAEGVDLAALARRYPGLLPPGLARVIRDLARQGLVVPEGDRLRLTRRGWLVSNEVFERLDIA